MAESAGQAAAGECRSRPVSRMEVRAENVVGAPGFEPGTFCTPRGLVQITQRPDIAQSRRIAWGCASPHKTHMTQETHGATSESPPNRHFYMNCHVRSHGVRHNSSARKHPEFTARSRLLISLVIGFVNHI